MAIIRYKDVGMTAIAACVPKTIVSNMSLGYMMSDDAMERVVKSTGIEERRIADEDVFTDGELIYVCPGASLTIIGITTDGERIQEHNNIPVYTDVEQDDAPGRINLKGAVLAGGNSKGGTGGIYIDSGKEVVIKEVAIAGCKASTGGFLVSYSGPGGGIIITESGTTLKMQNSRITGCLAEDDGGAIYGANDDNITIELDNSTIENNYANSDTGGINLDGSELTIRGKNKSKIKNNKGEGYGGGIYFWNDDTKITADKLGDLTIDGNSADEGGGIYINKENNEISNLVITNNNANKGGGIYIANDYTTINNCTITDNKTHGVYVENECDKEMCLKGATVIKGNSGGNLKIYDGTTFFSVDRNDKMNIFIGYVNNPSTADGYRISSNVSVDTSNQFTADDDAYTVAYTYRDRDGDDGRRLFYIKKSCS